MTDTVTVRIGGEDFALPLIMNFATMKRCSPAMDAWEKATDPVPLVSASVAFIAALFAKTRPELTQPALEEKLRVKRFDPKTGDLLEEDERLGVITAVREVCIASGLVPTKPAAPPPAPAPSEEPNSANPGQNSTGTIS